LVRSGPAYLFDGDGKLIGVVPKVEAADARSSSCSPRSPSAEVKRPDASGRRGESVLEPSPPNAEFSGETPTADT
jgi:hypothetical protein